MNYTKLNEHFERYYTETETIERLNVFICSKITHFVVSGQKIMIEFEQKLSGICKKRLEVLGFDVKDKAAYFTNSIQNAFEILKNKISCKYNGCKIRNIIVDELANITATINNKSNTQCGKIEDYDS